MTTLYDQCAFCGAPTFPHCNEAKGCAWMRCGRCHAYGKPGIAWRNYDKGAAFNFQTMNDVQVGDTNALPATRKAIAGYTD